MEFLDKISYPLLVVSAILLGLAPFHPMPHLVEKILMLKDGNLKKPIDIFDLLMHSAPFIILALKVWRDSIKS